LVVAAAVALPAAAADSADPPGSHAGKVRYALQSLVAGGAPGAIVLFREGGRTRRFAGGVSDLARRTPMRASDRFRIGSVTKAVVATVVLQLAGERKLALGDTVERWLPGLVPNAGRITLRQLLNHTSGLFDYVQDPRLLRPYQAGNRGYVWTPRSLVALSAAHPPLFAPGARWSLSNTNYIVLGLVVEAVTGHPLAAELSRRIFAPLHLRGTSFEDRARIEGPHAHAYLTLGAGGPVDTSSFSASWAWSAGAIVSTADDLARFYRALLGGLLLRPALL